MKKIKIPNIRFKCYIDEWECYEIKELCSISTGKSNTQDKVDDGEYPFYVRSPIVEKSNKYLYDEEAVITVGDGVGTGKVFHYVNGKYDLHQRCYRMFNFNNVNAKYFYYIFSTSFYKRVMAMTAKTSVDSVRLDMIAEMPIHISSLAEQQKIGNFFTNIDELIIKQNEKIEKLLTVKKSLLDKMFPKEGSLVPEIRFKDFTEKWKQNNLSDFVEVLDGDRGKNYPSEADFNISGHTLFLNASNVTKDGFSFKENQFITEEKSNTMGNGKLIKNDIIVTSRGSLGHIAWYNENTVKKFPYARINSGMLILRGKYLIDTEYLYQFMKSNKGQRRILFMSFGSAQPQLTKKGVESLIIDYPETLIEQQKIGKFFSKLDKIINLNRQKLEKLKSIKKALLQKMFV